MNVKALGMAALCSLLAVTYLDFASRYLHHFKWSL